MTRAEHVIENAKAFIAAARRERETDVERRRQLSERVQLMAGQNRHLVKLHGGEQLVLKLDC
jgi:hypothetical protein